jgi:hypothetical protein
MCLQRIIYTFGTSRLKASELPYDKHEASVLGHRFAALLSIKLWDSIASQDSDSTEKEISNIISVIEQLVAIDKSFACWLPYAKFLLQELDLMKKRAEHSGDITLLRQEIWRPFQKYKSCLWNMITLHSPPFSVHAPIGIFSAHRLEDLGWAIAR